MSEQTCGTCEIYRQFRADGKARIDWCDYWLGGDRSVHNPLPHPKSCPGWQQTTDSARVARIREAQLAVLSAARKYRASFEPQSPDSPCDTGHELDDAIFAMTNAEAEDKPT